MDLAQLRSRLSPGTRTWLSVVVLVGTGLVGLHLLIEAVYKSGVLPSQLTRKPLEFYVYEARRMVVYGGAVGGLAAQLVRAFRTESFAERFVPDARPSDLGLLRMLAAGILLVSVLWEDLPSTAALPREMMKPLGVMRLLAAIPGYEAFTSSAAALSVFQWLAAIVLFCAAVGFKTRISVPAGALCYLIVGGLLRQYAWFYHTGLIPLYVLTVLAFLPSGHGYSIDRMLRKHRGKFVVPDVPSQRFGWARYAVWAVLVVPYVAAGLSKLRNGGLLWWDASNFRFILYQSSLRPMEFDFDFSLQLATAPDWLFAALGLSAVLGELLYGLNLFSRRARMVMPLLMLGMHAGILLLQNILFFDLMLLQLIFLDFRSLTRAVERAFPPIAELLVRRRATTTAGVFRVDDPRSPAGRRLTPWVTILLTCCWILRVEVYPLTGMQMFSSKRSEPVTYERALAYTRSGDVMRAPIETSVRAMSDGRYRRILEQAFEADDDRMVRSFLTSVVGRWNDNVEDELRIERIELQRWEWYYLANPADPDHGEMIDRVVYPVSDETTGL